jgi:hypothetical protein
MVETKYISRIQKALNEAENFYDPDECLLP